MNVEPMPRPGVDVAAVLDGARVRGLPLTVFVLTTLALIFDGYDVQAMAFAAPALLHSWGLERAALAPVLAWGLVGMATGALALSGLGDRLGRRPVLTAAMVVVALGALASASSRSPAALMLWRFVTGVGLGVSAPNAVALMVEFAPRSVRNLFVAITLVGVPIGGMVGAEVAADLIPLWGWPSVFYVGALLPALIAAAMGLWLQESPQFLVQRPQQRERLTRLLNQLAGQPTYNGHDDYLVQRDKQDVSTARGLRGLLSPSYRHDTLAIWLVFFTNLFAVYVFFGWLPTALASAGLEITVALRGSLLFNLGGVASALLGAQCVTRWGSRPVLIALGLGGVLALVTLGLLPTASQTSHPGYPLVGVTLALMTLAGAGVLGLQVTMYSVAAHAYPTSMRVSGVGWAQGIARLAGIASAFAGSALLAGAHGLSSFFLGLATVLTLTFAGVLALRRQIRPTAKAIGLE